MEGPITTVGPMLPERKSDTNIQALVLIGIVIVVAILVSIVVIMMVELYRGSWDLQ